MTSIHLGDRGKMRTYLKELFDAIDNEDYLSAKKAFDKFRYYFRTYHITRGAPVKQFDELFDDIYYSLFYATPNQHKKAIMEDLMEQLSRSLFNYSVSSSPVEKLRDLYSEIRYCYGNIEEENTAAAIIDCFDEIAMMKSDFEKLGEPSINFFPSMVASFSDAEPILLEVASLDKPPAALLSKLADKFSAVFVSIQRVLNPPLKIPITKDQIIENLQSGASLQDIAEATANTEAELRALLKGDDDENSDAG